MCATLSSRTILHIAPGTPRLALSRVASNGTGVPGTATWSWKPQTSKRKPSRQTLECDMADFGVTAAGFTIKGLDVILADAKNRAQQIFDPTIDLTPTSP